MPRNSSTSDPNTPKARSARTSKKDGVQAATTAARWEASLAAAKGSEHVYSMVATYRVGDILLHEHFGKGVVLKLMTRKCTVLFQDKERLMASAN